MRADGEFRVRKLLDLFGAAMAGGAFVLVKRHCGSLGSPAQVPVFFANRPFFRIQSVAAAWRVVVGGKEAGARERALASLERLEKSNGYGLIRYTTVDARDVTQV